MSPADVEVVEATEVTPELVEAFERLVPQLSASATVPTEPELQEIVSSPATVLLLARDPDQDGAIVASMTLALFRIPTGLRAWIEDVVVDESARRRGVGAALNREAIARATEAGARTIDLTSGPKRQAARELYATLGFEPRDTTVYRHTPD